MFITVEGLDGSGKTTVLNKLVNFLNEKFPHLNLILTREPGGKDLKEAEKIREIILDSANDLSPVAEAMLYSTSRRIHLEKVVWPALKKKALVFCDRYIDSFYAYQGFARNLGYQYVKTLTELVIDGAIPNLTIFFDLTPEEAQLRRNQSRLIVDRMEQEQIDFHHKVYNGYRELIKETPERFLIIDASKSEEQVFEEVKEKLLDHQLMKDYLNQNAFK